MSVSIVSRRPPSTGALTKARIILAIVFLANLVMYAVYRTVTNRRQEAAATAQATPAAPDAPAQAAAKPGTRVARATAQAPADGRAGGDSALARAHRVAGLAA